jgi:hypothetical protein
MIKKQIKSTEVILIAFFFLIIISPAVGTFLGPESIVSEAEKRKLHVMPQFDLPDQSFTDYTQKFEAFLNDHFGFRKQFIRLNNDIFLSLFNKSPVKKVLIGKDGWLYIRNKSILENYYGMKSYNAKQLKAWVNVYEKRRLWLNEKGIDFAFVIAPNKMTIYPEYLPGALKTDSHTTRLEQLVTIMQENSQVKVVDLRAPLTAAKRFNRLYFKTDTHWNYYGAFVAYKNMLKEIFPGSSPMDVSAVSHLLEKTSNIDNDVTGDLIHMLKGGKPRHPKLYHLENACAKEVESYNITPDSVGVKPPKAQHKGNPARHLIIKACSHGKYRAIVFRDSFFSAMECFFSEHFEVVVYLRKKYDPAIMEDLIEKVKPDIVIEEIVERNLSQAPREMSFYEQDNKN